MCRCGWGALPLLVALTGIALAWYFYIVSVGTPVRLAQKYPALYRFLLNKWYFDELYDAIFVKPAKRLGLWLWQVVDTKIIDGLGPNGAAFATFVFAGRTSRLQTGYVYHYAFGMLLGFLVIISWVVFR